MKRIFTKIIKAINQYPADAQSFRKDLSYVIKKTKRVQKFYRRALDEAVESSEEAGVGIEST